MPKKNSSSLDLSLIMISYNTKEITLNALRSIYKYTKDVNFEIILVDHDSKDGSIEALKNFAKTKDNLTFLDTRKNPGFGAGNNLGAKKARGEYLLFINTDVLFRSNVLKQALSWVRAHPEVGAYSCKLLNKDLTVQATGGYFPNLFKVFAWQFFIDDLPFIRSFIKPIHPHEPHFSIVNRLRQKRNKKTSLKSSFYNQPQSLDWITGAFIIIPRKLFEELKGFDENIWMYAEELELCYRIKKLGFKVAYQTTPSIIHLGGSSSGGSRLGITQEIKNLLYFFKKHKPAWQLPIVKLLFIAGSILRFIIFGLLKNNETARKSYSEGLKLTI